MEQILKGKVIVVSGGTKGIGKGIILESAKQGANVVIGGRDKTAADKILEDVRAMGRMVSSSIRISIMCRIAQSCLMKLQQSLAK